MFNPFPGLRPFEADEDHLFFGREKEIDELLRRLRLSRFVSIIGTSGSGKSSLVRSGLIPSLCGGFMVNTSPSWRIAIMRPGEDPVRHLAAALNVPSVLGVEGELETTNRILLEATLERGTRGLVEAVRQARALSEDNLLVVVDQFEELFRFSRNLQLGNSKNEALAFVKLLLEAAQQQELPIYIAITMRSDFIGDCIDFPGLPEAINSGLFLVPRMTREELRSAITGPIAVGGGKISQRLVLRLLNDFGEEYDQLPVLQHALMRTWDYWANRAGSGDTIDIDDYEAIGTSRKALSIHAEEAYEEVGGEEAKRLTERTFKALTDIFSDTRGIRRPTRIGELAAIGESSEAEVIRIIEIFRRPGRSFLTPSAEAPLTKESVIDISHESLMRCWVRLAGWAEQERISAEIYSRLSDAAIWCKEGRSGLWRNPELEVAQKWRTENKPTAAWAERYNTIFAEVIGFLDRSLAERERENEEKRRERRKKFRQIQSVAGVLACLLLVAALLAYFAWREKSRAEANLQYAQEAVDESLAAAGSEQAREASDIPEMEIFRGQLLQKARTFYNNLSQRNTETLSLRIGQAEADSHLGDIDRLMGRYEEAVAEYERAIASFERLIAEFPAKEELRQSLAYSHNWLGETIRTALENKEKLPLGFADADKEYSEAITLQEALHNQKPENATYQQELARTYYNRGISRFREHDTAGAQSDFQKAIGLLEPLQGRPTPDSNASTPLPAQDLARVYNNFANVLQSLGRPNDGKAYYEKAVALAMELVEKRPNDREAKMELAEYANNEARMLADDDASNLAVTRNQQAIELLQALAQPSPSLSIALAESLQLAGQLAPTKDPSRASMLTDQALTLANRVGKSGATSALYMNIGANYLEIAQAELDRRNSTAAATALANATSIMPYLSPEDRQTLAEPYSSLMRKIGHKAITH
jgi:hypothetical protein